MKLLFIFSLLSWESVRLLSWNKVPQLCDFYEFMFHVWVVSNVKQQRIFTFFRESRFFVDFQIVFVLCSRRGWNGKEGKSREDIAKFLRRLFSPNWIDMVETWIKTQDKYSQYSLVFGPLQTKQRSPSWESSRFHFMFILRFSFPLLFCCLCNANEKENLRFQILVSLRKKYKKSVIKNLAVPWGVSCQHGQPDV